MRIAALHYRRGRVVRALHHFETRLQNGHFSVLEIIQVEVFVFFVNSGILEAARLWIFILLVDSKGLTTACQRLRRGHQSR